MEKLQLTRQQIIALAKNQDNPDLRYEKAFLMHLFGSANNVFVFENLIGWLPYSKRPDGSIYKSDAELAKETGLSKGTIERSRKILKDAGFDIYVKKANGAPTNHYRFDLEKFIQFVAGKLNAEVEKVRAWLHSLTRSKAAVKSQQSDEMDTHKPVKITPADSASGTPQTDEITATNLLKSSTVSTAEITTTNEKTSGSADDCWVYDRKAMLYGRISSPDIQNEVRAEVHRLHLLLKLPETQIEDWINEYGYYRVNNLTRYAFEDHRVKYPESWVALGLKNKFKLDSKWQPVTSRIDYQTGPYVGFVQG